MDVTLRCQCGRDVREDGALEDSALDLMATCGECGRSYVVTVTQFAGPN
jgi:hypothetical protein